MKPQQKRAASVILLGIGAGSGLLVAAGAVAIPAELRAIAAKMQAIQTLQVRMHQEKEIAAFGEKLSADGTLVFARPRRLLLDLTGAGGTRLLIQEDTLVLTYKALGKTERLSLSRDPRAKAVAEHLFLLLDADPEALARYYSLEVLTSTPLWVRLRPLAEALSRVLSSVDAKFDARGFATELVLKETNGDVTRWSFSEPVLNAELPESLRGAAR